MWYLRFRTRNVLPQCYPLIDGTHQVETTEKRPGHVSDSCWIFACGCFGIEFIYSSPPTESGANGDNRGHICDFGDRRRCQTIPERLRNRARYIRDYALRGFRRGRQELARRHLEYREEEENRPSSIIKFPSFPPWGSLPA